MGGLRFKIWWTTICYYKNPLSHTSPPEGKELIISNQILTPTPRGEDVKSIKEGYFNKEAINQPHTKRVLSSGGEDKINNNIQDLLPLIMCGTLFLPFGW